MNLTLATVKNLIKTPLNDAGLGVLIGAVNSDIRRLGGDSYPMRFSGALLDTKVVSAAGADTALTRDLIGGDATIGSPRITSTRTSLAEVTYTLAALDSGAVSITITGDTVESRSGVATSENLSVLADDGLFERSFYLVGSKGRIELQFGDAEDADPNNTDRVVWNVEASRQDSARTLLTGMVQDEHIRFVVAMPHAGLRMSLNDWNDALDRIAVSCLRIAAVDKGVVSHVTRGADIQETVNYLGYSDEYNSRLRQVLALTGEYFG